MNKYQAAIFATLFFFTASCDIVEDPIEEGAGGGNRDVIIMDFTGHKCPNCPEATQTALSIQEDYPEHVFVMSLHPDAGGLTTPQFGEPGDPFTTDFRTDIATHLDEIYEVPLLPAGVINGIEFEGSWYQLAGSWRQSVDQIINDPKIAEISINLNYDTTARNLNISTSTLAMKEWNGPYNLSVVLVEDSIVDWQKNGPPGAPSDPNYDSGDIPDYVHRHVLRGSVNGTQGTSIVAGDVVTSPGSSFTQNYNTSIDEDYNHSHMEVYAFIFNVNTYEIIDISKAKLVD